MICCTLLYVHSSITIILMGKRELVALLNLSSWCLVMVERLLLAVPRGCLWFVVVVFPDHAHLLFLPCCSSCCPFKGGGALNIHVLFSVALDHCEGSCLVRIALKFAHHRNVLNKV